MSPKPESSRTPSKSPSTNGDINTTLNYHNLLVGSCYKPIPLNRVRIPTRTNHGLPPKSWNFVEWSFRKEKLTAQINHHFFRCNFLPECASSLMKTSVGSTVEFRLLKLRLRVLMRILGCSSSWSSEGSSRRLTSLSHHLIWCDRLVCFRPRRQQYELKHNL